MHDRHSFATTLVFFGLGAAAGAALGMLFAPAAGQDTRLRVGRRLRQTADSAREMKGRILEGSERALRTSERTFNEMTRSARQAVSALSRKVEAVPAAAAAGSGPAAEELS